MAEVKVHIIGKCPVKGCKNRPRRHTVTGQTRTDRYGTRTTWGLPTGERCWTSVHPAPTQLPARPSSYPTKTDHDRIWVQTMRNHGFVCETHDRFYKVVSVQGVVNLEKACTAKCMGATGPSCECACGGELHGSTWG